MKRTFLAAIMVFIILGLAGCGGGGDSAPPTIVTDILSDPAFDGDIERDPLTGAFTITQVNTQSVFAGIDPVTGAEFRAFLDFPLTGVVPGNAVIVSAFLDIFIDDIQPLAGTIPIRIDLVSFQPPTLVVSDFDLNSQRALATITTQIFQSDFRQHVLVDVTSLMVEAQRLGLADFQVRILEDLGIVSPGLIEINDTTGPNRGVLAPLLQVTFF
ncbi:MAG: hypothetical protein FD174_1890 [Geobacteraceae bacterium]|nr:MAG: hypothetical protein FD174_1890 [Geobacteraceae bacterium]